MQKHALISPAICCSYPGGVVLSYLPDVGDGECPWLRHGRVPDGEGVLTMAIDSPRRRAFFLTWPSGRFGVCDLHARGAAGNDFSGAAALGGVRSLQGWDSSCCHLTCAVACVGDRREMLGDCTS
eukprot:INCI14778.1.p4 GENE.INCI14778.1~~INCI14778.1.p4  ORF type:complete len:125 (-),score=15.67 INCI14778.1:1637-2011(-)